MSLQSFGEQLKVQREKKQLPLPAISAATRINLKFLIAIEQGQFSILPQAYIRAFLREYAAAIDLTPDEVVQQYLDEVQTVKPPPTEKADLSVAASKPMAQEKPKASSTPVRFSRRPLLLLSFTAVAILILLYLSNTEVDSSRSKTVSEVPFDRVVQESEATLAKHEPAQPPAATKLSVLDSDSLTLEIHSTDSVWVTLLIDKQKTEEYLFPPNWRHAWKAKEEFLVTMGNAGGATFRLNGVELGALGRRGSVVRNIPIRGAMLPQQ